MIMSAWSDLSLQSYKAIDPAWLCRPGETSIQKIDHAQHIAQSDYSRMCNVEVQRIEELPVHGNCLKSLWGLIT